MYPAPIILCPLLHHALRLCQVNCLPFNLYVFSLPHTSLSLPLSLPWNSPFFVPPLILKGELF